MIGGSQHVDSLQAVTFAFSTRYSVSLSRHPCPRNSGLTLQTLFRCLGVLLPSDKRTVPDYLTVIRYRTTDESCLVHSIHDAVRIVNLLKTNEYPYDM